jgi:hypothetical protein
VRECSGTFPEQLAESSTLLLPVALTWIMRWLAFSGLPLVLLSGCGPLRTPYEPETSNPTPEVERLVDRLERAINNEDPTSVCRLYAFPGKRCEAIWRARIDALTLPVDLSATKLTGGCAGDVRVSLAKHPSLGDRLGTLTVVSLAEGAASIGDVAFENRLSSFVLPRYNGCADFEDGSAGSLNLDRASSGGQGNSR